MTETDRLRSWLFGGLAVGGALDRLETEGLAVRDAAAPGAAQRVLPLEEFAPDVRRAAMEALPAYLAFFCLENSVRDLITERLSERHGPDWWEQCAWTSLQAKVDKRREQEQAQRWNVRRGAVPIFYTDFGDLTARIRNNWSDFEDLFPDQNWIVARLSGAELSRNIIAHSNTLEAREINRLRLYLRDWIVQAG